MRELRERGIAEPDRSSKTDASSSPLAMGMDHLDPCRVCEGTKDEVKISFGTKASASSTFTPHDQEAVEAECGVDDNLVLARADERGQPATLPRVHEQEDDVVAGDEIFQLLDRCGVRSCCRRRDGVTRHGDGERVTCSVL